MANLPITADTSQLDGVTRAMNAMLKSVEGLAKVTPRLETVLTQLANKAEKLQKNQKNVATETDNTSQVLKRQQSILEGMVAGYSRGESSILATARAAGVTTDEFKKLEAVLVKQREISGKNPFDDTIGATRKLSREIEVLEMQYQALSRGTVLAKRDAEEYVRTLSKARTAAEQIAGDPAEWASEAAYIKFVNKLVAEQTAEFKKLVAERDKLTARANVFEGLTKGIKGAFAQGLTKTFNSLNEETKQAEANFNKMKAAGDRVDDTLARMTSQVAGLREGLTKEASAGLFAFEQTARAAGKTEQEIGVLVARYKGLQMEMTNLSAANRRTGSYFYGLQGVIRAAFPAAGALGLAAAVVQVGTSVIETSDSLTLLSGRITVATGGMSDLNKEFGDLLRIANESRTSVQDVGLLYARLIPVVQKLGGTTAEAGAITESFSKLLLLGGTNTREASQAILQFSQALGKGKLDGDEFRTVAEATPEVLRLLEDSLGVTRGELMKMAADGQLTSDILGNVLIDALDSLDARLMGLPITTGQAFQLLKNNLTDSVRLFENATGGVGTLANGIRSLAAAVFDLNRGFESKQYDATIQSVKTMTTVFGGLVISMGLARTLTGGLDAAYKAYTASAGLATLATNVLNKALGLNPFIRIVTVVLSLVSAYALLKEQTFSLNGEFVDLSSIVEAVFGNISNIFTGFGEIVGNIFGGAYDFIKGVFTNLFEVQKFFINKTIATFVAIGEVVYGVGSLIVDIFKNSFTDIANIGSAFFDDLINGNLSFSSVGEAITNVFTRKLDIAAEAVKGVAKAYQTDYVGALTQGIKAQYEQTIATAAQIRAERNIQDVFNESIAQSERERIADEERIKNKKEINRLTAEGASEAAGLSKKDQNAIQNLIEKEQIREAQIRSQIVLGRELTDTEKERFELTVKYGSSVADLVIKQRELNDANQTALDLILDYNKEQEDKLKTHQDTIKSLEDEIKSLEREYDTLGLSAEKIREYDLEKKRAQLTQLVVPAEIARLEEEIRLIEKRNAVLTKTEVKEAGIKAAENTKKEFDKIQDDIAKAVGDAIISGGQKGKDVLKNMFKAQVFRIFIEPVIRNGVADFAKILGINVSGSSKDKTTTGGISGGIGGQGSLFGSLGTAVSPEDYSVSILGFARTLQGSSNETVKGIGDFLKTNNQTLGNVAAALGALTTGLNALDSFKNGQYLTGIGQGVGYYLGGSIGSAVGGFIGKTLDKIVGFGPGGGPKQEGGYNVGFKGNGTYNQFTKELNDSFVQQYKTLVEGLGGVAKDISTYSFIGADPRGSANTQLAFGAKIGNQTVYDRTASGRGYENVGRSNEALQAELEQVSTRALVASLKLTDFADNIDAVFQSVNATTSSLEDLKLALSDAQLLNVVNTQFEKMGGSLSTLVGASIKTVKSFLLLTGGVEGLQKLQEGYVSSIYTDEEKLAISTSNLNKAFATLGVALPTSTAAFKQLVEAQDLTTAEGQAMYTALLALAPAFKEVTSASDQALEAQKALSKEMLNVSNSIRETINKVIYGDMKPVNQLDTLQAEFNSLIQKALSSTGQDLIDSGNKVNSSIEAIIGKASEIYASGPEYQRIKELVLGQALAVANRIEELAPLSYQEESISLLQSISNSSALTASAITGNTVSSAPTATVPTLVSTASVSSTNVDVTSIVTELKGLRQDVIDSGSISLKIVTPDGQVIIEETLTEIKKRSKNGELVIYADGVK